MFGDAMSDGGRILKFRTLNQVVVRDVLGPRAKLTKLVEEQGVWMALRPITQRSVWTMHGGDVEAMRHEHIGALDRHLT